MGSAHKPTPNHCAPGDNSSACTVCVDPTLKFISPTSTVTYIQTISKSLLPVPAFVCLCLSQNWALHFQLLTKEYALTSKAMNLKQNLFFSSNPNLSYFSRFSFMNMRNVLQPFWYPRLKSHIKQKDGIVNCPLLPTLYNLTAVLISLSLPNDVFPFYFPFHYCTQDFYHFFRQVKWFPNQLFHLQPLPFPSIQPITTSIIFLKHYCTISFPFQKYRMTPCTYWIKPRVLG